MSKTKRTSLLFLSIVGILILLLAMSLPQVVLSPGQPFSLGQSQAVAGGAGGAAPGGEILLGIFRGILALALILLPVYIIFSLQTADGRRRLLVNVILITLLLLLAEYLRTQPLGENKQEQEQETALSTSDLEELEMGPPTVVFQPTPPTWLTPVVILLAALLVMGGIWAGLQLWQQRRKKRPGFSLEKLAQEAQTALESLQAGSDFKLTVIHCYQEMSRIVRAEKGIEREAAMTPREFEDRLVSRGLPADSIRTLTRIFEQVRYGQVIPGTDEENLAFSCLTAIVNACKSIEEPA